MLLTATIQRGFSLKKFMNVMVLYTNKKGNSIYAVSRSGQINFNNANTELQKLHALKTHSLLKESPSAFNPGIRAVEVAEKILQGVIAEEENKTDEAITSLTEAVDKEDAMLYNEPRDWLIPARHYLGKLLIKANQHNEAEKRYREDLLINPNNGWALTGLEIALRKQNKMKEALSVKQQVKKALTRTDSKIAHSVF